MKRIPKSRRYSYMARAGVIMVAVAVVSLLVVACGDLYSLVIVANPSVGGNATAVTGQTMYTAGSQVTIQAVAAEGYRFVNWTAPAGSFVDANSASTQFTMPEENVTVTANFVVTYAVTMTANPPTGGSATDVTGQTRYVAGAQVTIEAVSYYGHKFVNWTAQAGSFADADSSTTQLTMPAQDVTVTANFAECDLASEICIDFEDLVLNTDYSVGFAFIASCVQIDVEGFQLDDPDETWVYDGFARVSGDQNAGGSGQDIQVANVNLWFHGGPWDCLSLLFGHSGGNLNIEVNGQLRNFSDFREIDGETIGGVEVSVVVFVDVPHRYYQGMLVLSGTINHFAIGGGELWIDNACLCMGGCVPAFCVDFEDLVLNTDYSVGNQFWASGVQIDVEGFQLDDTDETWVDDGFARVSGDQSAGGSGKDIEANNVNLRFHGGPWDCLSLLFGDWGGNLNIEVNGHFRNFCDFREIDGETIGGVEVSVAVFVDVPHSCYQGMLFLSGTINSFAIGGQELFVDNVCLDQ